jgi:hypothetical protein
MSHQRTVVQFVQEVEHVTGVRVRIRWMFYYGMYLEDPETGNQYAMGPGSENRVLSPEEQESICRGLNRKQWVTLLGLNLPEDED